VVCPAQVGTVTAKRIENKVNTAEIVIVSAGVRNFEITSFSAQRRVPVYNETCEMRDPARLRNYVNRNKNMILESFDKNYEGNSLTYWMDPKGFQIQRKVILINCLFITDPADDRNYVTHNGRHAGIQSQFAEHKVFEEMMAPIKDIEFDGDDPLLIIFMCKSGRHRSVAGSELMYKFLKSDANPWRSDKRVELTHLSEGGYWDRICQLNTRCPRCSRTVRERLHEQAEQRFAEKVKRIKHQSLRKGTPRSSTRATTSSSAATRTAC